VGVAQIGDDQARSWIVRAALTQFIRLAAGASGGRASHTGALQRQVGFSSTRA
jgi:hypothetical protein